MNRSLPFLPSMPRRPAAATNSSLRPEVCPPSLRQAPDSGWQRALFWLMAPAPQDASPAPGRLHQVRCEFDALLADIDDDEARTMRGRIADAHTLRDLWHLRTSAYRVIGIAHSQGVAEERLARLNHHFPTRAPRSGFASLP